MISPTIETKALYLALASNVTVCNTYKGFELSKNDKVEFVPFSNNLTFMIDFTEALSRVCYNAVCAAI